jgi:hypothetical protein
MLPPDKYVLKRIDPSIPLCEQVQNAHVLIPTTGTFSWCAVLLETVKGSHQLLFWNIVIFRTVFIRKGWLPYQPPSSPIHLSVPAIYQLPAAPHSKVIPSHPPHTLLTLNNEKRPSANALAASLPFTTHPPHTSQAGWTLLPSMPPPTCVSLHNQLAGVLLSLLQCVCVFLCVCAMNKQ